MGGRDPGFVRLCVLTCALPLALAGARVNAQDCVDYGGHLAWAGGVDTPGEATCVAVAGGLALVADGAAGVQIFDLSDPLRPALVNTVDTPGTAVRLCVQGHYAYVADDLGGVQVIDIASPLSATIIASVPLTASVVAVQDSVLAVGSVEALTLVNVKDPLSPVVMSSYPHMTIDFAFAGHYLYVSGYFGLELMDIADPARPVIVRTVEDGYFFWDASRSIDAVAIAGDIGFVRITTWTYHVGSSEKVELLDVSDPGSPVIAGAVPDFGLGAQPTISGSLVFAAVNLGGARGLEVWDASDVYAPVRLGRIAGIGNCRQVAVAGSLVYAAELRAGLQVYDADPPSSPEPLVRRTSVSRPAPSAIAIGGNLAYCLQNFPGSATSTTPFGAIWWMDPSDAGQTSAQQAFFLYRHQISALAASGSTVLAASDLGLHVLDMSVPTRPLTYGPFTFGALHVGGPMAVARGRVFAMGDSVGSLLVVDVANPAAPVLTGELALPRGCLTGAGEYLYSSDGDSLYVVDVADPDHPRRVRALPGGYEVLHAFSSAASGNLLLAGSPNTLTVLDLAEPSLPAQLGSLSLRWAGFAANVARKVLDVQLRNRIAYLAVENGGLCAVDLSDPRHPRLIGETAAVLPNSLAARGDLLLATDGLGFAFLRRDCGDAVPIFLSDFTAQRAAAGVRLAWHVAGAASTADFRIVARATGSTWDVDCAPDGSGGFVALDGSPNASRPGEIVYELSLRDPAGGWTLIGNTVCKAADLPARTCLRGVHPNPFNPATTITFAVDRAQDVRLSIHDLKGREVAVLTQGPWPAGEHTARWDGTDTRGRPQASGVYVVELRGETAREARKIVLSR